MRIVFAGTPEFAVPPLSALLNSPYEICGVYTQPDRPAGRGRKLTPSPVKVLAQKAGLPVFQPETLKDEAAHAQLRNLKPDLMVVVAYGLLLPQAVIDIPPLGCINIHASLLPRWRGAAPIQRSILAGDSESGVTIMYIEPRLDAGPMLLKKSCPIGPDDTAGDLHDRLSRIGAEALLETLPSIAAGTAEPEIQDESLVTHAAKINKDDAQLDWSRPAAELQCQVRAFNPWPVAETVYRDQILRVWRATVVPESRSEPPGTLLIDGENLDVVTGHDCLRLLEIQLPGGKRISARDFINGHPETGLMLGARP
ncbi:MAG: methionyl-tRNA formyltransferase [Methylococcus sp.]